MMYYNYYYSTNKKEFFLLGEKTYIISILTTLEKYSYVLYGIRVRVRDVRAYYKVTHTHLRDRKSTTYGLDFS